MKLSQYVDTKIGTLGDDQTSSFHGGGKTYPGAVRPFGMVQLSPDTITGGDNGSGYSCHHETIEGFSFNHMSGVGWYGDLGNLQVMPTVGRMKFHSGTNEHALYQSDEEGYASTYSHDTEVTKAGYYSVYLEKYKVNVEVTATKRCGILRMKYDGRGDRRVQINLSRRVAGRSVWQRIKIVNNNTICGEILCTPEGGGFGHGDGNIHYTLHFYAQFNVNWNKCGVYNLGKTLEPSNEYEGEDLGFFAEFDGCNSTVLFKSGISYASVAGAYENLSLELNHWDFDKAVAEAQEDWDEVLKGIEVEGSNEERKKIFYTTMYHTKLDPRIHYDNNRNYFGADKKVHTCNYEYRTVFSGWDVYRSEFPLLTITDPNVVNDTINTLIEIAQYTNSTFPRWELMGAEANCMNSDPGVIVTVDAYMKNIRNYDVNLAYDICKQTALGENTTRKKAKETTELGYIPHSISSTLENTFVDWTIHRFAEAMGEKEISDMFKERSKNYKNVYDSSIGWMRRKDENGQWCQWGGKYDTEGCLESNVFQQTFFVPHDIEGLQDMFGRERFVTELEALFSNADLTQLWNEDYNHSNEPCHNIPHLFNYAGLPKRTQHWVRKIQDESYRSGFYGFCGNEDVGQLSAWYVLTALGFHQTTPGNSRYDFNTPLFKKAVLKLNKEYHNRGVSDTLEIRCDKDPEEYKYIKEVYLNGSLLDRTYIMYDEITNGGVLEFILE